MLMYPFLNVWLMILELISLRFHHFCFFFLVCRHDYLNSLCPGTSGDSLSSKIPPRRYQNGFRGSGFHISSFHLPTRRKTMNLLILGVAWLQCILVLIIYISV